MDCAVAGSKLNGDVCKISVRFITGGDARLRFIVFFVLFHFRIWAS